MISLHILTDTYHTYTHKPKVLINRHHSLALLTLLHIVHCPHTTHVHCPHTTPVHCHTLHIVNA